MNCWPHWNCRSSSLPNSNFYSFTRRCWIVPQPPPELAAAWEAASAAHAPTPEEEQANEAVLALIALGYKQIDAHKAVRDLQEKGEAKSAEELVKLTLKKMAAGR